MALTKQAETLIAEGRRKETQGKALLPRLQLSMYINNYYKLKVEASRHMQSLLERMDMATIKSSLSGGFDHSVGLSNVQMEIIRSSLRKGIELSDPAFSLNAFVQTEVAKESASRRDASDINDTSLFSRTGTYRKRLCIDPAHIVSKPVVRITKKTRNGKGLVTLSMSQDRGPRVRCATEDESVGSGSLSLFSHNSQSNSRFV